MLKVSAGRILAYIFSALSHLAGYGTSLFTYHLEHGHKATEPGKIFSLEMSIGTLLNTVAILPSSLIMLSCFSSLPFIAKFFGVILRKNLGALLNITVSLRRKGYFQE